MSSESLKTLGFNHTSGPEGQLTPYWKPTDRKCNSPKRIVTTKLLITLMGSAFEHTSPSVLVLEIVIFYREHIKFSSQTGIW